MLGANPNHAFAIIFFILISSYLGGAIPQLPLGVSVSTYDFEIKKTRRDFVLIRIGTDKHSHFRTSDGAEKALNFIRDEVKPFNRYFDTALKRILTEDEYKRLRTPSKQKYINRGFNHV